MPSDNCELPIVNDALAIPYHSSRFFRTLPSVVEMSKACG
jgi:hypothetical protein